MKNKMDIRNIRDIEVGPTMEMKIAGATKKISKDIGKLNSKGAKALSAFRKAANQFGEVNESLETKKNALIALQSFIAGEQATTEKMMADNERVRAKIFEIIGE